MVRAPGRGVRSVGLRTPDEPHRVTTFELFFDLVFVFAFTQVTVFMAAQLSAISVFQGLIVLGILWWSWVSHSWVANRSSADHGAVRIGMSVSVAATFLLAMTITEAFEDQPGGIDAPLVFALSYIVVRLIHFGLHLLVPADSRPLGGPQSWGFFLAMATGSTLIVVGAAVGDPAQTWLWFSGLAVDVGVTYLVFRRHGWRVHSVSHWAERYRLIVIIALGESIFALGLGVARQPIDIDIMSGVLLAITVALALWWLYFDITSITAEHQLSRREGQSRATLALEAYAYLHFPIIAGIVISALGIEQAVVRLDRSAALGLFGASALFAGPSLFLLGAIAYSLRAGGSFHRWRIGAAVLLVALIPVAAPLPSLLALSLVTAILVATVVVERARYAQPDAPVDGGERGTGALGSTTDD